MQYRCANLLRSSTIQRASMSIFEHFRSRKFTRVEGLGTPTFWGRDFSWNFKLFGENPAISNWDFVGFQQPPKFSFLLHFLTTIFSVWGFNKPKFFEKFQNFRKNFAWWNPALSKTFFVRFWLNFAKNCRFRHKNPVFSKFRRLRRRNVIFSAAFGGRSVISAPPLWARTPPQISLVETQI